MYKSFEVRNFRCFRKLFLDKLERVNLVAGLNNVGKTALLEALFLHCGASNPELTMRLNAFRGVESIKVDLGSWSETPWHSLFWGYDVTREVELVGENTLNGQRSLRLKLVRREEEFAKLRPSVKHSLYEPKIIALSSEALAQVLELEYKDRAGHAHNYYMILDPNGMHIEPTPPPPPFPAIFLGARIRIPAAEDAERLGKLEILGQQDVLLKILKLVEPRLRRLAVAVVAGVPMIHGDAGLGRLVPLPFMGEGMVRICSLVLAIANSPKGVVLVDEVENGLHHSILNKVWTAVAEVARQFDVQIFATTHSLECIVAAHMAFIESGIYDFRLHRLEHVNDAIRAVTYDRETLEAAIEMEMEVR